MIKFYDLEAAIQFYIDNPTLSGGEVARRFGIPRATLAENLRKRNVPGTAFRGLKYSYDKNYFKDINSCDKAYWLGFIQADGSISKRGKLRIRISSEDVSLLELLKKDTHGNMPITKLAGKGYLNSSELSQLKFDCVEMTRDLMNHGIQVNKSLITQYIDLHDTELQIAYIRGLFDGDGWISLSENSREFGISGTQSVCSGILNFLNTEFGINGKVTQYKSIYRLRIHRKPDIVMLSSLLYKNSNNHFLYRKYIKLITFAHSYDSLDVKSMSMKDRKYWKAKLGVYEENIKHANQRWS